MVINIVFNKTFSMYNLVKKIIHAIMFLTKKISMLLMF